MQLRLWAAAAIFTGSYLPLALILLAQDYQFKYLKAPFCLDVWSEHSNCAIPFANPAISLSIFILCLLCFFATMFILYIKRGKRSINIVKARYIPAELMNYTLPYVVSFMGVGYQEEGKFLGIAIFLIWMFWITYRSGQIILNPLLIVFGWRLYEITYRHTGQQSEHDGTALSKVEIGPGDRVKHGVIQDVIVIQA